MRRKALIFLCLLISALTLAVISSCDGGIFGASKYTVNFYDGTELLLSVSVFDTKNVSAPRLSDRDGYESNGFVGSDGVTAFGEDYPFVRGAANDFYAVWSKKIYNITYELNGGVNGDNPETYTVDDAFTLADAYKDGFEFIGWTCSFSRIPSKNLSVTRGTYGDLRFVANFIDENLYYLYFDALGGGALSPSVSENGVFSSAPEPDREGYAFSGWYLDEEYLSAAVFPFCATEKVTTLYAKWQPKTYHIYSADGSFETVEYTVETPTFDLAKPNKTGYKFVGFSEAGKTEMTAVFTVTKGSCKDYTVSSHFVAIDYFITFNTLGGSEVDRLTANYLDDISAPTAPVKDNCDFIGWFEDELLSTPFVFDKMPAKSFTLYAGWHSDMNFSLNYTAEFSAATITSNKPDGGLVTAGENVCLCAPTYCDGGIFLFWEKGGAVYSYDNAIDFIMPASNVSFYASYAELDTVSYNKDSGGDLEILFPSAVSALTGAGLKSSDYRCSSNKLTVYSSALCAFSAGYYPLSATTQNGSVYFALKVYATEKTIVGLSLDYDINYPSVSLVINGDKSASYEYSLDGAAFVPALEVTVLQGYDKSLAHTVTVRNVSDAQDRFTVSRRAAQNYENEYLEDTFYIVEDL